MALFDAIPENNKSHVDNLLLSRLIRMETDEVHNPDDILLLKTANQFELVWLDGALGELNQWNEICRLKR